MLLQLAPQDGAAASFISGAVLLVDGANGAGLTI
jgi:hypothetical protein